MDILDALADDVSLEEFFMTWASRLFAERRDDFATSSDIDLVLCFKFQDTDEVYSLEMSAGGLIAEDDEMIDFPAITLIGWAKFWPRVKAAMRPIAQAIEQRRAEVRDSLRLTESFYADWEKFDVVIDVEVRDDKHRSEPVTFSIVFNDYDPPSGARRFGFAISLDVLEAMAKGVQSPEDVARGLKITGDVRIAATLGGMILSHAKKSASR